MADDIDVGIDLAELMARAEDGMGGYLPATGQDKPDYSDLDVSTKAFWAKTSEERDDRFRKLRLTDPVSWQRPVEDAVTPDPDDPGYWAVVKHGDITRVSKDNGTFISGQGVLFDLLPPIFLQLSQSFLAMDPPRHHKLRTLVSAAFTPRQIKKIEDDVQLAAREIVDDLVADGARAVDAVSAISERLPVRMFSDLFGLPEEFRAPVAAAAADVVAWADPETLGDRQASEVQTEACMILHSYAKRLIDARRANPTDDLLTSLIHAEVDGQKLDDFEIGSFFVLMAVAGTDTTKHTTSFTLRALAKNPDQLAYLREDYEGRIPLAIEEFIRYASPVMTFRRTCVKETELGGRAILPGDKVVMFYPSGSFDEDVFDDPWKFDLTRRPNQHLGFGGGGIHYCLGSALAKTMLRSIFRELVFRLESWETGEPELLGTNFMRAIKRMPMRFVPAKSTANTG
jgi:cytochrome P450